MHIDASPLAQQIPHQRQPLEHHMQIGIRAFSPGIPVGDGFEDGLLLLESVALFAELDLHREVRADVERRVDVNQIDLSAKLLEERSHDEFVIAPDEHIAKIVLMRFIRIVKKLLGIASIFGLVDRLDSLER